MQPLFLFRLLDFSRRSSRVEHSSIDADELPTLSSGHKDLLHTDALLGGRYAQGRHRACHGIGPAEDDRLRTGEAGEGKLLLGGREGRDPLLVDHALVQAQDSNLSAPGLGVRKGVDDPVFADKDRNVRRGSGKVGRAVQDLAGHRVDQVDEEVRGRDGGSGGGGGGLLSGLGGSQRLGLAGRPARQRPRDAVDLRDAGLLPRSAG